MLSLAAVSAGYGSFQALFGVSLDVARGEAVGVIGPNGAGKTTLMRVISGMLPMNEGSMTIEGQAIGGLPAHHIIERGIAHVPENRRLDFVFELFPRMKERRHQLAGTMSGGEQQMCAIGRALMSDPKLLLLDEPSAGLAPVVVQQVFELVRRIRESGLTVLIVEQNVQQVLKVVDRAYLLEAGTIRASGTSEEMLSTDTIKQAYLGV